MSPAKAQGCIDKHPTLFRFSDTISIAENRLAGPFNYVTLVENNKAIGHRIPKEAWNEMGENATLRGVDVLSMRQVAKQT